MKTFQASVALVIVGTFLGILAACGSSNCAELEKKKSECKGEELCEKAIGEAVKAGKDDVCKAALDNMNKNKK